MKVLIALVVVIAASAGVVYARSSPQEPAFPTVRWSSRDAVVEIRLSDGTRCAVYQGYKAGGIACDWKRP